MHEHWQEYGPPAYRSLAHMIGFEGKTPEGDGGSQVVRPYTEDDVKELMRAWGQNV